MHTLLSYRNWSLLVVLPSIGLLTIAINYPILVGFLYIANDLPFATCLVSIKEGVRNSELWEDSNVRYAIGLLISYFFGFVIQAINTTWWSVKSDFYKCAKLKSESNQEGLVEIVEYYRKKKLFSCTGKNLGCCFIIRQLYEIRKYFDYIDRIRLMVVCKTMISVPKQETSVPPTAGEPDYAAFQLFLEDNKSIASYLEWEKFLASFYEYLIITLTLSGVAYISFGLLYSVIRHTIDVWLFLSYPVMLILYVWMRHASKVHTNAKMRAEAEAYRVYKATTTAAVYASNQLNVRPRSIFEEKNVPLLLDKEETEESATVRRPPDEKEGMGPSRLLKF